MTKSNIKKYKKKPVEIEALEWTGDNRDEVDIFVGNGIWYYCPEAIEGRVMVKTEDSHISMWDKEKLDREFEEITDE